MGDDRFQSLGGHFSHLGRTNIRRMGEELKKIENYLKYISSPKVSPLLLIVKVRSYVEALASVQTANVLVPVVEGSFSRY